MPAGKLDLLIEQGATFKQQLLIKQGDSAAAPAMDLTGYTARMHMRTAVESADVAMECNTINGRINITPLEGRIDIVISATDTAALTIDGGVYDLEIESAGGEVTRVVQGKVKLSREVTR